MKSAISTIQNEIRRCDEEIAAAKRMVQTAVASGNRFDQQLAELWLSAWEVLKQELSRRAIKVPKRD